VADDGPFCRPGPLIDSTDLAICYRAVPQAGQVEPPIIEVGALATPVAGIAFDYAPGHHIPEHRHDAAQLIFATSGVMTVRTSAGSWVVPTQRAVWVPTLEEHSIRITGHVDMRTIYVCTGSARRLHKTCAVIHVSGLLRELVLRIVETTERPIGDAAEARLARVFFDELKVAPQVPLHLPSPTDARLLRVTEALQADLSDQRTLAEWARVAGASERTLARLFVSETQMTFGQWCQQARLLRGLELIALGRAVTQIALDLGYESPSAFIAMFRKATGTTPLQYFRTNQPV